MNYEHCHCFSIDLKNAKMQKKKRKEDQVELNGWIHG
jgi:hypothetical protein